MKSPTDNVMVGNNKNILETLLESGDKLESKAKGVQEDIDKNIEQIQAVTDTKIKDRDSQSRSRIAFWFSCAFILLSGVIIIGGPIFNAFVPENARIDIPQLLSSFGSLFGTALGFVLGYYFKDKGRN